MINQSTDPLLAPFRFRSIGPASMGGRIDDIAVAESDPNIIYLGYAVGGVFKSENNGTTFEPVFDDLRRPRRLATSPSIRPIPNIVYVGTGEPNNRQTSSFGDGIYKTTDGGKTFTHIGLRETQTIARIVIDPQKPGHGLRRGRPATCSARTPSAASTRRPTAARPGTRSSSSTRTRASPTSRSIRSNSNILYAASYQRRRSGCCFNGGGPGSALWKTTDAGKTWTKLTGSGLPPGTYGRIALDVSRSNPNVVYAQIEAGRRRPAADDRGATIRRGDRERRRRARRRCPARRPHRAVGRRGAARRRAGAPAARGSGGGRGGGGGGRGGGYNWCNNAGPVAASARGAPAGPAADAAAARSGARRHLPLGQQGRQLDARQQLQRAADVLQPASRRSDATTRRSTSPGCRSRSRSTAARRSRRSTKPAATARPGHVDQHAIWIDPKNPKHLLIGNDGGFNVSWDQGRTWDFVNTMATALAYWVSADMRRPYYVYIGLQDNGSWGGPSATRSAQRHHELRLVRHRRRRRLPDRRRSDRLQHRLHRIAGRQHQPLRPARPDACRASGRAPSAARAAADAAAARRRRAAAAAGAGAERAERGSRPIEYRFNWNTPFQLSPHNPSIVWLGGNRLFKSYNRGDTWIGERRPHQADRSQHRRRSWACRATARMLSKNDGVVAYSTIISISESPVMPGVVWAGTDDGNVQVSRDGGTTFTEVGKNLPGLPPNHLYWISRIDASHFDAGTAYVSVDGHRSERPEAVRVRDARLRPDAGRASPATCRRSATSRWCARIRRTGICCTSAPSSACSPRSTAARAGSKFMNNLPTVRVDDILVHPRDNDLIVATHARGVWIADDITPLQQATQRGAAQDAVLFDIRPAVAWLTDRQRGQQTGGQRVFVGENPPRGTAISYYLKTAASGDVKITIADGTGRVDPHARRHQARRHQPRDVEPLAHAHRRPGGGGFGRGGGGAPVPAGTYIVTLDVAGKKLTKPVTVLEDVWMREER